MVVDLLVSSKAITMLQSIHCLNRPVLAFILLFSLLFVQVLSKSCRFHEADASLFLEILNVPIPFLNKEEEDTSRVRIYAATLCF
jgi:hypothetical protein